MRKKRVVVTGWGQVTDKNYYMNDEISPFDLMKQASYVAFERLSYGNFLKNIDGVMVVKVLSHNCAFAANRLAEILNITPSFTYDSGIGGHSPQYLINEAAGMIERGELKNVLVAGAELYYSEINGKTDLFQGVLNSYFGDDKVGFSNLEKKYGLTMPLDGFSFFETALWADSGLTLKEYMIRMGELISEFSKIANMHKNAWFCDRVSVDQVMSSSYVNSVITFPYTKFMCPFFRVNMGAAILLSSESEASKYCPNFVNKVYFVSGAYSQDRQRFLVQKEDFISSDPIKYVVQKALARGLLTLDKIECFDFYSCFPCAVFMAKKILEIDDDDKRMFTLTGGLSRFGGPGNNYSLHAVSTLVDMISRGIVKNGMITALGWFIHKNAVGIYSSEIPDDSTSCYDLVDRSIFFVGNTPLVPIEKFTGKGFVETYTVFCNNSTGFVRTCVVYCKTSFGFRFIAKVDDDCLIDEMMRRNCVGKIINVVNNGKLNIVSGLLDS